MKASIIVEPHGLKAHELALQAAASVIRVTRSVPPALKPVADQAVRSAAGFPLNLAEGAGRFGRDRTHHWRIAYGSGKEAASALRLLAISGAVKREQSIAALELLDRALAMTWRLLHPKR